MFTAPETGFDSQGRGGAGGMVVNERVDHEL
jgi:hypothetical protein